MTSPWFHLPCVPLTQKVSSLISEIAKVRMETRLVPWLQAFYKKDDQLVEVEGSMKVADLIKCCGTDINPLHVAYEGMFITMDR